MEAPRKALGQGLVAAGDLPAGTVLSVDLVAYKRPLLDGLPADVLPKIIGRKTKKAIKEDEQISWEFLE